MGEDFSERRRGVSCANSGEVGPRCAALGRNRGFRTHLRRKVLRRLPSQQAHLLALVLGADQRTGGGQAAHAIAVWVGQL